MALTHLFDPTPISPIPAIGGIIMAQESMRIIDKGSYLLVEFFGEFSVDAGKQCIDMMTDACEKNSQSRVLLDCRKMTGNMPVIDRFQVAEYGATKHRQISRIALLNREEVMLPGNFVENVAVNRFMNMKIFTHFGDAEDWLTQAK